MLTKTNKPKLWLHMQNSASLIKYTGTKDNNQLFSLTGTL